MLANRRTKIVATVGPSLSSPDKLKAAIENGLNVVRLNFSHGTHEDHKKVVDHVRDISAELRAPVAILQDLQGPKVRVGKMKDGKLLLEKGKLYKFSHDYKIGEGDQIPTDFAELAQASKPGVKILLDDGLMDVVVREVKDGVVTVEVMNGGVLKDRKGMNLPDVSLPVECLTPKDLEDLEFGLKEKVDYIALSFVRRGSDIQRVREIITARGSNARIVAKIEMLEAIEHLEEIVTLSDAVMVARGDLAVEAGQTRLPSLQKRIIRLCNKMGKPVITATQMLESMVNNPRPTRAEVTDVANAVIDGSDAVMLSAESASGKYPIESIRTMHEIILEVEKETTYDRIDLARETEDVPQAIAASSALVSKGLKATAIVCLSTTGKTAALISRFRPQARLIAITDRMDILNRLELVWGVQSFSINTYYSMEEIIKQIESMLLRFRLVENGDFVVLTLGLPIVEKAKTNSIRVFQVHGETQIAKGSDLPVRCRE